jgi:hypothetical protein
MPVGSFGRKKKMITCKGSIDFLLVHADIDNDNILPLCACVTITVCVYNLLQSCFRMWMCRFCNTLCVAIKSF